jgi:hypothetical protein
VQSGVLHRQQVVTRADAAPAVRNRLLGPVAAEQRRVGLTQLVSGAQRSLIGEVPPVEVIRRAGDVAGDGVERLLASFEAFGSACVDEQRIRRAEPRDDIVDGDGQRGARARDEGARRSRLVAVARRPSFAKPLRPSSIEHRHGVVTEVAQRPPEAAGEEARVLVVGDDLRFAIDAEAREQARERVGRWERMPSARRGAIAREILVEAHVDRARHVRSAVLLPSPAIVAQVESAVDNGPVGEICLRDLCRNDGGVDHGDSGAVIW